VTPLLITIPQHHLNFFCLKKENKMCSSPPLEMVGCPAALSSLGPAGEALQRNEPLSQAHPSPSAASPGAGPLEEGKVEPCARTGVLLCISHARRSETGMDSGLWQLLLEPVCPGRAARSLSASSLNKSLFMSGRAPAFPAQALLSVFLRNA